MRKLFYCFVAATVFGCTTFCAFADGTLGVPAPTGGMDITVLQGGTAELDVLSVSAESVTVGDPDSSPGIIGLRNSALLPDFSLGDGDIHYNGIRYYRTTDNDGYTVIKKMSDDSVYGAYLGTCFGVTSDEWMPPELSCGMGKFYSEDTLYERVDEGTPTGAVYIKASVSGSVGGSYFGDNFVTGIDLSNATQSIVKNYLYSSGAYEVGTYDYELDGLTKTTAGTAGIPSGAVTLVDVTGYGTMLNYTSSGSGGGGLVYRSDLYNRTTDLDESSEPFILAATLAAPASGYYVTGATPTVSVFGPLYFVSTSQALGIGACYDSTTEGAALESICAFSFGALGVQDFEVLVSEPVAGQAYHVAIVTDGTTGVDYYVDGVLLADETDFAPPVNADLSTWADTKYGMFFWSGFAGTSITGSLENARIDNFQFFYEAE